MKAKTATAVVAAALALSPRPTHGDEGMWTLDNLPVKGLEVRDEEIFVSGIPWEKVNQSKRWLKSFEIGSYGAGALNLMVADEAECLGPVNWKAFEAAVIESGRTVIAARLASKEEIERHGPQLRSEPQGALSLG